MDKKPFHETVAEKLIEQLQQGTAPWQRPWEPGTPSAFFPLNPTTGNRYKGINAMFLMAQGRTDQRWMTYKQAIAAGAQVRKGERGTPIQYWKFQDEQVKTDSMGRPVLDGNGDPLTQSVKLERPRVFFATVFNAEQIDGLPPVERTATDGRAWDAEARAEAILAASQAVIRHSSQGRAYYQPGADEIHLPNKEQFPKASGYYATALHELGHWTGHESRLDRDLAHPFGSEVYAKEELRAEIASMILGDELGIGHDPGQHAAYVASWVKVLQDDPLEIFRAAADAEKIHEFVMAFEQKQLQETSLKEQLVDRLDAAKQQLAVGAAHLVQQEHFVALSTAVALEDHPRKWEVFVLDKSYGFADSEDAFDAVVEVHRRQVNNALFTHAVPSSISPVEALPSPAVMRDYPDLVNIYQDLLAPSQHAEAIPEQAMQSLPGRSIAYNGTPGFFGAEIVEEDGFRMFLDGQEAIQKFAAANWVGLEDMRVLLKLNAYGEQFRTVPEQSRYEGRYISTEGRPGPLHDRLAGVAMSFNDAALAGRLRDLRSTDESSRASAVESFKEQSFWTFGFNVPADWDGRVIVEPYTIDAQSGEGHPAEVSKGVRPDFYGVFAVSADGKTVPLQEFPTQESAEALAVRLRMIDAHAEINQDIHHEKLAALLEDAIRGYSDSQAEQTQTATRDASEVTPREKLMEHGSAEELRVQISRALGSIPEEDARVAAARREVALDSTPDPVKLERASVAALEVFGFDLPPDWTGQIQMLGVVTSEGRYAAAPDGQSAEAYQLFARRGDAQPGEDAFAYLTMLPTEEAAMQMTDRLALVNAASQVSERETAIRLAGLGLEQARRNVNATDEERTSAKEVLKWLQAPTGFGEPEWRNLGWAEYGAESQNVKLEALLNNRHVTLPPDAPAHLHAANARIESGMPGATYLQVPYKEKALARDLGAKWDKTEKAWFVPANLDPAPFAKWIEAPVQASQQKEAQAPGTTEPERRNDRKADARKYLAVPYDDRHAAKSAGAAWDKVTKSWYAGPEADIAKLQKWLPENVRAEQEPPMPPREEFAERMRELGLVVEGDHPLMDGNKHRVPVEGGKKGAKDGFYVLYADGHPAGRIINNLTGADEKWKSKGYSLTAEEKAAMHAVAAANLARREADQTAVHEATAARLLQQLEKLQPVEQSTPYLASKGVETHYGAFTDGDNRTTFIPAIDVDNKLWTMQYIQEDGTKRFAKDSRKEGCFHAIGGLEALEKAPALVIGEGYATAATLSEVLGYATVAAFDSGNLTAVAKALHERYPDKAIVIAGDDDKPLTMTHGKNPGRIKAQEAAEAVSGVKVLPVFAPGEAVYPAGLDPITPDLVAAEKLSDAQKAALSQMKKFTDWNDVATRSALGRDGVARQVRPVVQAAIARREQELTQSRERTTAQRPELKQHEHEQKRPRRTARA